MNDQIRNKLNYLILLKSNPLSDQEAINKIRKELEWIDVGSFSTTDMQLLNQALK